MASDQRNTSSQHPSWASRLQRSMGIEFVKREGTSIKSELFAILVAMVGALLVSTALIISAGQQPSAAFSALLSGAFGDSRAISETLIKATPLIFTGLAATLAFRGKIWNIGAEGQLFAGAILAYAVSAALEGAPKVPALAAVILASFLGGLILGLIPAVLKSWFEVDEIISTVLLNYIVTFVVSYLISGPWRDPSSYYMQTRTIPEATMLPHLFSGVRLHAGFILALLCSVGGYLLIQRTPLGYEIRAVGSNQEAAKFKGIGVHKLLMTVLMISGGVAGFAGLSQLNGVIFRLRLDMSSGYGFSGIIIAMLANLNPLGVVPAAILFGGLFNGATRMQVITGLPIALVSAIQGIVLLFLLAGRVLSQYKIQRINHD